MHTFTSIQWKAYEEENIYFHKYESLVDFYDAINTKKIETFDLYIEDLCMSPLILHKELAKDGKPSHAEH